MPNSKVIAASVELGLFITFLLYFVFKLHSLGFRGFNACWVLLPFLSVLHIAVATSGLAIQGAKNSVANELDTLVDNATCAILQMALCTILQRM
jgi:hypothetical protein